MKLLISSTHKFSYEWIFARSTNVESSSVGSSFVSVVTRVTHDVSSESFDAGNLFVRGLIRQNFLALGTRKAFLVPDSVVTNDHCVLEGINSFIASCANFAL